MDSPTTPAAGSSAGKARTIRWSASTPPADAPITIMSCPGICGSQATRGEQILYHRFDKRAAPKCYYPRVRKTVVLNVVGLTRRLIESGAMPRVSQFVAAGRLATVESVVPAVTCSVQSTYLTGACPSE